jgi:2-polyprenyl-3-methyl-5-hydroxy-6-metoxy-1,4-benzoquinol methylase
MLISDEYRRLNQDLHNRATFGQRGGRHAPVVRQLLADYDASSVLDYGCGRGDLAKELADVDVCSYDPAVTKYASEPQRADIVVCTDVLEHIEPDCLYSVLAHLKALTGVVGHFVVATKLDGSKKLADGRDPHLIVKPAEWWHGKLSAYFNAKLVNVTARDCTFRCFPRT